MAAPLIYPGVLLHGNVEVEDDVIIYPGAKIGFPGESHNLTSDLDIPLRIGRGTIIREDVCIQRGVEGGQGTYIGENCYLMHGVHIGHDSYLGPGVTLSPNVVIGGHSNLLNGCTLGILSATHQWVTIGQLVMVGMGSMVIHDVPPGRKVIGSPARDVGPNTVGIERAGRNLDEKDHRLFDNLRCRSLVKPA